MRAQRGEAQITPRTIAKPMHTYAEGTSPLFRHTKEHHVPIRPYLKEGAFSPEAVSVLAAAFEDVCKALDAAGRSDLSKDAVAIKIIELARAGETDAVVLRELALSEFGLSDLSEEA